jgi:hypothetical protein
MSDEIDRPVPDAGDSAASPAATPAPEGQGATPPPPPPPPPPSLPPAVTPRRRSRRPLVAGAVALVVAVGAVALVVGGGGDEPSAAEALERAEAAIAEAGTFRMHTTSEDRSVTGDAGGAGSSTVYRTVTDTEVAGDSSHSVYDSGDWADEEVQIADGLYTRSAESTEALADEPWVVFPPGAFDDVVPAGDEARDEFLMYLGLDYDGDGEVDPDVVEDEFLESTVVPTLAGYYLFGLGGPADGMTTGGPVPLPSGLVDTFGSFEDAEVVSDGGGELVIAATRAVPPELAEGIDVDLPPGRFEITLGQDDLPTRLELTVDGTDAHYTETVEFADWGADIAIGVPEGEIDETPWLDEEALAEARGSVQALAPTVVPDGLALVGIHALAGDDDIVEDVSCAQLALDYGPASVDPAVLEEWYSTPDYLTVYLMPSSCALDFDDTSFEPGEFGDLPSREIDGFVEVLVGETVLQFDTSYTSELPAIVASIQPFDLDAELARVAPLAEGTWYSQGM